MSGDVVKPAGPDSRIKYFETPAIQRLLRRVKEGVITEFRPYFDAEAHNVQYTDAQMATELNNEQTKLALELLADEGILNREPAESYYTCPQCSSKDLLARARCNYCDSESIVSSKGLEHLHCGYREFESTFSSPKGLVCPKCKENMKALGVDYRRVGVLYRCMECGRVDSVVQLRFACNSCKRRFAQGDAKMQLYHVYRMNPETKERIEKYLLNHEAIRDALADRGYEAGFEQKIQGRSGLPVEVDLAAWTSSDGGEKQLQLIADFKMVPTPIDTDTVRLFLSKMEDLQVKKGIIITLHGATEQARKLAKYGGISLIDCSGIPSIPEKFETALNELFEQQPLTVSTVRINETGTETQRSAKDAQQSREKGSIEEEVDDSEHNALLALMYGKQEQTLKLIRQISQRTRADFKRLEELLKKLPEVEDSKAREES